MNKNKYYFTFILISILLLPLGVGFLGRKQLQKWQLLEDMFTSSLIQINNYKKLIKDFNDSLISRENKKNFPIELQKLCLLKKEKQQLQTLLASNFPNPEFLKRLAFLNRDNSIFLKITKNNNQNLWFFKKNVEVDNSDLNDFLNILEKYNQNLIIKNFSLKKHVPYKGTNTWLLNFSFFEENPNGDSCHE